MRIIAHSFICISIALSSLLCATLLLTYNGPHYPFYPSPNYEDRPKGTLIDTIVLHATQIDTLAKTIKYFSMPESRLSAHFTVGRAGEIVQHVGMQKRAWHAGESQMKDGRKSVNDFSLGIEIVNLNDGVDPYTPAQIRALRHLIREIKLNLPIKFIVTHAEIAVPYGRKSDPLGLNLAYINK